MKSTCSTIIIGLFASILSTSNGFVITSNNNNPINTLSTRLFEAGVFEGGDDDTTTSSSKPTSRPDFEFSFEVPKKGIADIGTAEVKLPPLLESSELVVVRAQVYGDVFSNTILPSLTII